MSRIMPSSMLGAPNGVATRQLGPALRRHQLRPAAIKAAMVDFAVPIVAGPGFEVVVEALVTEPHFVAQDMAPGDRTASGLGAALPIVHVVLLERAGRTEHPHPGQPDRLFDRGGGGLV